MGVVHRKKRVRAGFSSRRGVSLGILRVFGRGCAGRFAGKAGVFVNNFRASFFKGKKGTYLVSVTPAEGEAPISVSVSAPSRFPGSVSRGRERVLAEARLWFSRGSVDVKALQGSLGVSGELRDFEDVSGEKWPAFIMGEIERSARGMGFSRVRLAKPETLDAYKRPFVAGRVRNKLLKLKRKGIYDPKNPNHEKIERGIREDAREKARESMSRLYYGVAQSMGYSEEGCFFVKHIVP